MNGLSRKLTGPQVRWIPGPSPTAKECKVSIPTLLVRITTNFPIVVTRPHWSTNGRLSIMKVNRLFETWLKCDVPNLTTAVVASSDFLQVNQEPREPSGVINLLYVSAAHTATRDIATATPCSPHPRWRQVTGHTCHISMPKAAARAGPTSSTCPCWT